MHLFQQVILLVRIRVVDTRDRDSVIDASLINRSSQGVLRELEARSCDKCNSGVLVLVTGSLEKLPDLLGPTCSSLYTHRRRKSIRQRYFERGLPSPNWFGGQVMRQ